MIHVCETEIKSLIFTANCCIDKAKALRDANSDIPLSFEAAIAHQCYYEYFKIDHTPLSTCTQHYAGYFSGPLIHYIEVQIASNSRSPVS